MERKASSIDRTLNAIIRLAPIMAAPVRSTRKPGKPADREHDVGAEKD